MPKPKESAPDKTHELRINATPEELAKVMFQPPPKVADPRKA